MKLQLAIARLELTPTPPLNSIPLIRQSDGLGIVYKSAVAFKLEPFCHETLTEVAGRLAGQLGGFPADFSVTLVPPGWLYFHCNYSRIGDWLECLLASKLQIEAQTSYSPSQLNLIPLQYAHARCCSILRLAAAQGWCQIDNKGDFLLSPPIPWFDPQGLWHLVQPHEANAIASLADLTDNFHPSSVPARNCWQLAMQLAESWELFERKFRLFEVLNPTNKDLNQCRLAIILAIKHSLNYVIQELCHSVPWTEL